MVQETCRDRLGLLFGAGFVSGHGQPRKHRFLGDRPSGAEAPVSIGLRAARLKPCPFKTKSKAEFFHNL
jgi:hypothetical protein